MRDNDVGRAIFDFVYSMALDDATKQNAYLGKKEFINSQDDVKALVRKYIDAIFDDKKNPEMMLTAWEIKKVLKGSEFSFGNIQKLINMSAKYMYISCYPRDKNFREKFECCDCPMDSRMIHIVRKKYKQLCKEKNISDELLTIPDGYGGYTKDGSLIAWSKIGFEEDEKEGPHSVEVYKKFQEMVKCLASEKGLYPIEYDYLEWDKEK